MVIRIQKMYSNDGLVDTHTHERLIYIYIYITMLHIKGMEGKFDALFPT